MKVLFGRSRMLEQCAYFVGLCTLLVTGVAVAQQGVVNNSFCAKILKGATNRDPACTATVIGCEPFQHGFKREDEFVYERCTHPDPENMVYNCQYLAAQTVCLEEKFYPSIPDCQGQINEQNRNEEPRNDCVTIDP